MSKVIILVVILIIIVGLAVFFTMTGSQKLDNRGVILGVKILPDTLTDELYIKMEYEFNFSEKFTGFESDYTLFVHFWRTKRHIKMEER